VEEKFRILRLGLISPLLLVAACGDSSATADESSLVDANSREQVASVLIQEGYGDSATKIVYLDQNWTSTDSFSFYQIDQGSVLLPYDTLIHLEQADSAKPLMSAENVSRYRFLPQRPTSGNPDALPVGFAKHADQVGLTCAACHTSQINYRGTGMRIDGAPALADMAGFIHAIRASLASTIADTAKLGRFAAARQGGGSSAAQIAAAKESLASTLIWFDSYESANHPTTPEGFGRVDAIGRIFNQIIRFTSDAKNSIAPSAPASLPELWDAPRHDYVQWTAFAPNAGAGALGRNVGEVIGVFGRVEVKHYETQLGAAAGYPSTIAHRNLVSIEESLRKLWSPVWPEQILPPIDRALASRGQALYAANCVSCHALINRTDPNRKVTAFVTGIDVVGTDDNALKEFVNTRVPTGLLNGAISLDGTKYGAEASARDVLNNVVLRATSTRPDIALLAATYAKNAGLNEAEKQGKYTKATPAAPFADLMSYKARPLNGVWATAPFLHNGSVPTIYDLLLPAAQRPKQFSVGRREYDPKKVGYVSDGIVPFVVDTSVSGNSNRGHEHGVTLTDDQRWALVEYIKTL
jgi:hypothetical protein